MRQSLANRDVVEQKLAAFTAMQSEFVASFQFMQAMHGQQRFPVVTVHDIVHYLHALWICEQKDRLLSVPKTIARYEGGHCLALLAEWQAGDMVGVVTFLQRKLDTLPFDAITRQLQAMEIAAEYEQAERLTHGRYVLLNRGMNLMQALHALFAAPTSMDTAAAQSACTEFGHQPAQIQQQLAASDMPLYAYVPNRALAQRNMVVMNELGVTMSANVADMPGNRSRRVLEPTMSPGPYAEALIDDYHELTAPINTNLTGVGFVIDPDVPEKFPTV